MTRNGHPAMIQHPPAPVPDHADTPAGALVSAYSRYAQRIRRRYGDSRK